MLSVIKSRKGSCVFGKFITKNMVTTYFIPYKLYLMSLMYFVAITVTVVAVIDVKDFRKLSVFYDEF